MIIDESFTIGNGCFVITYPFESAFWVKRGEKGPEMYRPFPHRKGKLSNTRTNLVSSLRPLFCNDVFPGESRFTEVKIRKTNVFGLVGVVVITKNRDKYQQERAKTRGVSVHVFSHQVKTNCLYVRPWRRHGPGCEPRPVHHYSVAT